ncbi:MAG: hypothetical protein RDU59_11830 [Thermodesulfobacteriota bacterium]|nr:hypothetical protein [Thermodesulfobacteriota bacterium]
MDDIDIAKLADFCRSTLGLADTKLGAEYGYGSLPLCVIDAIFSISVRYESVKNVIGRYCNFFRISQGTPDQQTLQEMIEAYRRYGVDYFVESIYSNRQRTSTSSGILKAEAVLRFACILRAHEVDVMRDITKLYDDYTFEAEIRNIPGQASGLSLRYFFMLSGNDDLVKPDRMITRFLQRALGRAISMEEAQLLITEACRSLKPEFQHLTPRLLDHAIWNFQRDNGVESANITESTNAKQYTADRESGKLPLGESSAKRQKFSQEDIRSAKKFPSKSCYYPFFHSICEEMRRMLPPDLVNFADRTEEGKNWMRIRYPGRISNGLYELQFASHSKNFARHFGEGRGTFLSFYKEGQQARLQHWLKKILPFKSNIEDQLGRDVKIDFWSDQWAFIGMRIDEVVPDARPADFAKIFVQFIQATFIPVSQIGS